MDDFPQFMRAAANRIATQSQARNAERAAGRQKQRALHRRFFALPRSRQRENRHSGKAADASRTAEFFFFDGGYDGGVIDRHGRGVAPEGPDSEGKHRFRLPRFSKPGAAKRVPHRALRHVQLRTLLHSR